MRIVGINETYSNHETYESENNMKTRTFLTMTAIGVMLLSGLALSQQTITYENFPKAKMMLIGIPLNFTDSDPGAVLEPEFGEQIRDGSIYPYWRFSRWDIGDHTYYRYGEMEFTWDHDAQNYKPATEKTEQGSPHAIEPGYGYWLAQSSGNTVDTLSLTGIPADQDAPVYVPVDPPETVQGHAYPGITMVSNPFLYTIDWVNAYYRINSGDEVTLEQAVNMGLVSQYAYPWDGAQYTPFNMTDGGNLKIWDGYWVEQLNPEPTEYVVYDVACDIESSEGGGGECGECDGQVSYLKLLYNGIYDNAKIKVYDNKSNKLYYGTVQKGGEFEFSGKQGGERMGPKIKIYISNADKCSGCGENFCEIHTSCSVPIGIGQVWGPFTITAGASRNGGALCPIGETNKPIIKFYDAEVNGSDSDLGEGGVIETDRFIISLYNDDDGELSFKTFTVNDDSSAWIALTQEGTAVSDGQGFTVTLISESEGTYTIDVASTGSAVLEAVKFRFGDDQTLDSPECGETFTSTRQLLGGVQVSTLELKTPPTNVGGGKLAKSSEKIPHPLKSESVAEWIVPISVSSSSGELIDSYNGFGVKEGASATFDLLDARNFTPNLDAWVDIYFPHHKENDPLNYWPQKPMKAAYDVRPEADVISWDMEMSYVNAGSQKFTINWDASQFPADLELTFVDFSTDERIDMLTVSEYAVTTPADPYGTLYFAVVAALPEEAVGIDRDITKPAEFRLLANYPNPFNATTRLLYTLPEAAQVKLTIYNLNGTLVNTLVNGIQPAGYYGMDWDGHDQSGAMVSTGVYIYRLQANGQVSTRKMLLMK